MQDLEGQSLLAESGPEHFKTGSVIGALSDEAIRFLFRKGRVRSLTDGEALFRSGDPGNSFFVVLQGQFDYVRNADGGDVLIRSALFGEELGYVAMIGLLDRVGVGRAHGPAVALEVSSDLFFQFHLDFPFDFGVLMLNLSRELARTIRKVTTNYTEAQIGHTLA
jgi:CRP-like cAMP-binding protein